MLSRVHAGSAMTKHNQAQLSHGQLTEASRRTPGRPTIDMQHQAHFLIVTMAEGCTALITLEVFHTSWIASYAYNAAMKWDAAYKGQLYAW